MQVWITGYHGFLREVFGVLVDGSDAVPPVSGNKLPLSGMRP